MKHLSKVVVAVFMAVLMATLLPAQVFADTPDYISEVKIATGSTSELEAEGYTLLTDGKNAVDLNQGAGGGWGSKGDMAVYLGYKTTKERSEAITDLALMNMKGGYSVQEYEALMEAQMKQQIIPFVDSFLATIREYRENYHSDNEANQQRAQYVHDILNKLTDDDCGGAGLGDLFLNETKYEMGDEAYNALSEEEKNQHADILTIIAQSNGKATLLMENLLTRAADTNDDTWIDRFSNTTYDDLVELVGGSPVDARNKLTKQYEDKAKTILSMWDDFKSDLENYGQANENVENTDIEESDYNELEEAVDAISENSTDDELIDTTIELTEKNGESLENINDIGTVAIYEYLENIEYEDGTLLDFFMQDSDEIENDIEVLYPLVASLTEGQLAGLEFINLKALVLLSETDIDAYKETELDSINEQSIYSGVDRAIYQKGGVALTSDALRTNAMALEKEEDSNPFSTLTVIMMALTGAAVVGLVGSAIAKYAINSTLINKVSYINKMVILDAKYSVKASSINVTKRFVKDMAKLENFKKNEKLLRSEVQSLYQKGPTYNYLMTGFAVAMIVLGAITTYLSYRDMVNHYKVDFTPIPHYMVDEKDITGYNAKGEKIVIKNQSAYYKVVECNRKSGDDYFDTVGTCGDINGYAGKQWLALYAAKNEAMNPILADSLLVKVGSEEVPAGYTTGIHMFGSDAAFNLNSNLYDWNDSAKSVFVYYKTDENAANVTGSIFMPNTIMANPANKTILIFTGVGGVLLGAVGTAFAMAGSRKKKEKKAEAV